LFLLVCFLKWGVDSTLVKVCNLIHLISRRAGVLLSCLWLLMRFIVLLKTVVVLHVAFRGNDAALSQSPEDLKFHPEMFMK
jgi:hypothetical protein